MTTNWLLDRRHGKLNVFFIFTTPCIVISCHWEPTWTEWQYFWSLGNFLKYLAILEVLFRIWQTFEPTSEEILRDKFSLFESHLIFYQIWSHFFFFKNGPTPVSFCLFSVFSNKHHYNFYNRSMWKNVMSIQYMVPGFEPTTFGTWASSHNN